MTYHIEVRNVTSNGKQYKAYYLIGEFSLDDNEILLGAMGDCNAHPDMCHVSFSRYRESPEMVDVSILKSDIDKVFQFYADYVAKKADEYQESREWENQMRDQADARIALDKRPYKGGPSINQLLNG